MMWAKHTLQAFLAFACGAAVSAGTFAFLLVIGVIPRILGKSKEAKRVFLAENLVILGVLTGAVFSVFEWEAAFPVVWISHVIFVVYGMSAGIFVGCISVALAEILNTFPIMFRRFYISRGLSWAIFSMAMGKLAGSLYYFLAGYGLPKYW
ncbi:MAG: stage V sporulation protein AB [Blautia sp.]|nr:stage V sporulation protein AB [Blautia sp.]